MCGLFNPTMYVRGKLAFDLRPFVGQVVRELLPFFSNKTVLFFGVSCHFMGTEPKCKQALTVERNLSLLHLAKLPPRDSERLWENSEPINGSV